jgi:aminoglycoside 2''-phosphotransferase
LDLELYCGLIASHAPGIALDRVTPITEGWDVLVVDVDDAFIFRFPRRIEVYAGFKKEIRLLPLLADRLPLAVPRPEYAWDDPEDPLRSFFGYRKIPGTPLTTEILANPEAACQLAAALSCLHTFPVDLAVELCVPSRTSPNPQQEIAEFYAWAQEQAYPLLSPAARAWSDTTWSSFLAESANFAYPPALIHADLGTEHILCDVNARRVNGIIDWGDAAIGDPAMDFVGLYSLGGRDLLEPVVSAYTGQAGAHFWQRVAFYSAIVPFYLVYFGLDSVSENLVTDGLAAIERQAHSL